MADAEVDISTEIISSDEEFPEAEVDISIEERPEFVDDFFDDIIAWAVKDEWVDSNDGDANDPNIVKHTKKPALAEDSRQSNKPVGREKEAQSKSNSKDGEKVKSKKEVSFFIPERRPLARSPFRSRVPYRCNRSSERRRRRESPPRRQATKKGFLDELKEIFASQGKDFPEIDMIRKQISSFEQQQMMNNGFQGEPQIVPKPSLNPYVKQNMIFPGIVNPIDPYAGYPQMNPNQFVMPAMPYQQINPESLLIPRLFKAAAALKRPVKIENKPRQKPTSTSTDFVDMKKKILKKSKIDITNHLIQMSDQIKTAAGTTDGINYFVEQMLDLSKQLIRAIEDLKRAMNTRDDERGVLGKHESEERRHEADNKLYETTHERFHYKALSPKAMYDDYRGKSLKRKGIKARLGYKVPSHVLWKDAPYYGESSRPKRLYCYVPCADEPGMADPRDYYQKESPPPSSSYRHGRNRNRSPN